MKRIAAFLAATLLLALCGCGGETVTVPETTAVYATLLETTTAADTTTEAASATTEIAVTTAKATTTTTTTKKSTTEAVTATIPILEPVILSVVQQEWDGFAYSEGHDQPKPKPLGIQGVDIGSVVTFHTNDHWNYDATITIDAFDDATVTVHFQTSGLVRHNSNGSINLMSNECDWIAVIPYGEAYKITSQTLDMGVSFEYTFMKNSNQST